MGESNTVVYPLEKVLEVRKRRVESAELLMKEKQTKLRQEEEKLRNLEQERDKVKQHYVDKLQQLRDILDHESTTDAVQQARNYITIVSDKLAVEESRVQKQSSQVDAARSAFEMARKEWLARKKAVEKIDKHREEWLKSAWKEFTREQEKIVSDMGTLIFISRLAREGLVHDSSEEDTPLFE